MSEGGPARSGAVRTAPSPATRPGETTAAFLLSLIIWSTAVACGAADLGRLESIRLLEDFERPNPLGDWKLRQVDATIETVADSLQTLDRRLALTYKKWVPGQSQWPSARLKYGDGLFTNGDWSPFERIVFTAHAGSSRTITLKLRIDDADGDRSIQLIPVVPGKTTCVVRLSDLRSHVDLHKIRLIDFYLTQPQRDHELRLDDIRLEAGPVRLLGSQLTVDPFGRGFHARVRLSRAARLTMTLVDDYGESRAKSHNVKGARLDWRVQDQKLQPGQYHVRAAAGTHTIFDIGAFEVRSPPTVCAAWLQPSTEKVRLRSWPPAGERVIDILGEGAMKPARLTMVRNETEALQLILLAGERGMVTVRVATLHDGGGSFLAPSEVAVLQVGYVDADPPAEYDVESSGWWPDPLMPKREMALRPKENMPIWISLRTRRSTTPGMYRGLIRVEGGLESGRDINWQLPLEVDVRQPVLPDTTTARTAFSLRRFMLEQVYGEDRSRQLFRRYRTFVGDHRLNVTDLYRQSLPPLYEVAGPARAGLINAFNLLKVDASHADSTSLETLAGKLDQYVNQLRRAGIAQRAYIYGFDEAAPDRFEALRTVFGYLKGRYPDIKTVTTARDPSYGLETGLAPVGDVWAPELALYDERAAEIARQAGEEVWWYIYVAPPHPYPNWFVEYPALEARLLWWMTYQRGIEGFLYYYLNRWPKQHAPLNLERADNRTDWDPASFETANGDGCLMYPGPEGPISTIRLANIRDGIEDFELLHQLTERTGDGGAAARMLCNRLITTLTDFTADPKLFTNTRMQLIEQLEETK